MQYQSRVLGIIIAGKALLVLSALGLACLTTLLMLTYSSNAMRLPPSETLQNKHSYMLGLSKM